MSGSLSNSIIVSTQDQLNAAILQLETTATSGAYTISFATTITEGEAGQPAGIYAISLPTGVSLTIQGGGFALNGAGQAGGLAVLGGQVTIDDLTIEDTVAQGGDGDGSAGGGAGLGGGLFVGPTAHVTIDNLTFQGDQAVGGNGGNGVGSGGAVTLGFA